MVYTAGCLAYHAFGLTLRSEIPLPELAPLPPGFKGTADVTIEVSDLSETWRRHAGGRSHTAADERRVLFRIPDSAVYCVEGGSAIAVSPLPGADEDEIRLYLLGTCMGAILLQRRVLPLHGSAVGIGGRAYALLGESGSGKSTLASALLDQGCTLLSDDVIAVAMPEGRTGMPFVTPAYPQQKLWQESLEGLGLAHRGYRPLFRRENKFSVPVPARFHANPLPLAGIVELVKPADDELRFRRISGLERLPVLYRHTFRHQLVRPMGLMAWHLEATAAIASRMDFYRLRRPMSGFTAPELASHILNEVRKEG